MADELSIISKGIVDIAGRGTEMSDVLKPLIKEIHLFDTFIAGTTYLTDREPLTKVMEGDKLTLRRENSKFDERAILVLNEEGKKLGYIPERDNVIFSRLMDAGKLLIARVGKIEQKGNFKQIGIGIFLVDY